MDLGDLVASAEQLTAKIDGASFSIIYTMPSMPMVVFRREQEIYQEWKGV